MRTTSLTPNGRIAGGRIVRGGDGSFNLVRIKYPAMTVSAADRTRLLAQSEIKAMGWDRAKLDLFLEKTKGIIGNLKGALGHYPKLEFFIDLVSSVPEVVLASLPGHNIFTFYFTSSRGSEFILENCESLLCENIAQAFLFHSAEAALRLRNPEAFVNGIFDNPYFSGLKIEMEDELRALFSGDFLRLIAEKVPEFVGAKALAVLHPNHPPAFSHKAAEDGLNLIIGALVEHLRTTPEPQKRTVIEPMLAALAYEAAKVQIEGFGDLVELIEQRIRLEMVPAEAINQLAQGILEAGGQVEPLHYDYEEAQRVATRDLEPRLMKLFEEIKNLYLEFFNGVQFKSRQS